MPIGLEDDFVGADIGAHGKSEGDDAAGMDFAETQHARIVGVEHGDTMPGIQRLNEFALGKRHSFDGIESLDVRVADVGDYPDIRGGDDRQRTNFAAWFMPISRTPTRASSGRRRIESGTPT